MKIRALIWMVAFGIVASLSAWAQQPLNNNDRDRDGNFRVTSSTFSEGGTLPLIMVYNQCSYYPGGGNQSPELSWTGAPRGTRSFVVVTYDVTASFTHWGMYNISGNASGLPQNAGMLGSNYGLQVSNDFGDLSYDGPCPPPQYKPVVHQYVFTVYALDIKLPTLPTYGDFSPGGRGTVSRTDRSRSRRPHS